MAGGRDDFLRWSSWQVRVRIYLHCCWLIVPSGMYHSGIGGGGFALARSSNGSYKSIDFRETAPAAAFKHMYRGNINGSVYGGLARYSRFPTPNQR